jgi:hypothetical protein
MKKQKKTKNCLELTRTQAQQLQFYLALAEKEGTYYGDKRYFDKRHNDLKEMIKYLIKCYL